MDVHPAPSGSLQWLIRTPHASGLFIWLSGAWCHSATDRLGACLFRLQVKNILRDQGIGSADTGQQPVSSSNTPDQLLYVNKWYTFAACAVLQLMIGVQYCFPCAPNHPRSVASCLTISGILVKTHRRCGHYQWDVPPPSFNCPLTWMMIYLHGIKGRTESMVDAWNVPQCPIVCESINHVR